MNTYLKLKKNNIYHLIQTNFYHNQKSTHPKQYIKKYIEPNQTHPILHFKKFTQKTVHDIELFLSAPSTPVMFRQLFTDAS